jgi:hypothetical protein
MAYSINFFLSHFVLSIHPKHTLSFLSGLMYTFELRHLLSRERYKTDLIFRYNKLRFGTSQ